MSTEIEVVAPLDVDAATRLDKRIRLMASTVRENLTKIATLVEEAKAGEIHVALGFSSWTAYIADALGGQIELSTESRRSVVELLAGEGMSNRAIATAVGVTEGTVRNDKVRSDYAPEPVTGLDGKTYKKKPVIEPESVLETNTEPESATDVERQDDPAIVTESEPLFVFELDIRGGTEIWAKQYDDYCNVIYEASVSGGSELDATFTPEWASGLAAALKSALPAIHAGIERLERRAGGGA